MTDQKIRSDEPSNSERATAFISMTQAEKKRYTELAKAHGMSMSSLVRLAIEKFMEENKKK